MQTYQAGNIKLTNGSDIVEGFGTRWLSHVRPGATLFVSAMELTIAAVNDNHLLTLTADYVASTLTQAAYVIENPAETLDDKKAAAIKRVYEVSDQNLERAFPFAYASPLQMAAFQSAVAECAAYAAAGYPTDLTDYPQLAAGLAAGPPGVTATLQANGVIALDALWRGLSGTVTGAANLAISQINAATTESGILTAESDYIAEMAAMWSGPG